MPERVRFLNCHFDNVTFDEVAAILREHVESREPGFMVSLNADIVVRLDRDEAFREAYAAADLALMDSQPLIRMCERQGVGVREKLSGSDLMPRVCELAAAEGYSCLIMGGREGVSEKACENLAARYPGLEISGYSPEYGFEKDNQGVAVAVAKVREADPDVMFICLGTPKSEKLLHPRLAEFGVPFAFSVGAAVDFAAGSVRRAPMWMQRAGLEWLYRFLQEPRRMFRRYFVDSWSLISIVRRCSKEA